MPVGASIGDVPRRLRLFGAGIVGLAALTACTVAEVETPDPEAFLSGDPVAIGADPTGPVTELDSGQAFDLDWRYVTYESADGWCTELQMAEVTSTGCGPDRELPEGEHLAGVGVMDALESGVTPVDGIVSDEIVTVFIIDQQQGRVPATLMPLEEAGLSGQAFIGFMPSDGTVTHVQAVALSGEILGTYEVP
jgi:hypothetical protein